MNHPISNDTAGPLGPQRRTRRPARRALGLVAALVLLVPACGDDDSDDAATDDPTTTTAAANDDDTGGDDESDDADGDASADLATFCDGAIDGETIFNAGPPMDETGAPTPEGLEEFTSQLEPEIAKLEANAPEAIAAEVETLTTAIRAALETGDDTAMGSPEVFAADAALDAYVFDNCELAATVDVVAIDYAYQGMPATVPAGRLGIRLDNQGEEVHEAVILRIDDEAGMTINEILELPEEEGMELAEMRGVVFADAGATGSAVIDLDPGQYALVCFVPVGTTEMSDVEGPPEEGAEPGGPPHFVEGMVESFEVT